MCKKWILYALKIRMNMRLYANKNGNKPLPHKHKHTFSIMCVNLDKIRFLYSEFFFRFVLFCLVWEWEVFLTREFSLMRFFAKTRRNIGTKSNSSYRFVLTQAVHWNRLPFTKKLNGNVKLFALSFFFVCCGCFLKWFLIACN